MPFEVHTDVFDYAVAAILLDVLYDEKNQSGKRKKREQPIQ